MNDYINRRADEADTEFEMPDPPDTSAIDWAIGRIRSAMRRRKDPGWTTADFERLSGAVRSIFLDSDSIPKGVQARFWDVITKLILLIGRRQGDAWDRFMNRLAAVMFFDSLIPVGKAIGLMSRTTPNGLVPEFTPDELNSIVVGVRTGDTSLDPLLKRLSSELGSARVKFTSMLRHNFREAVAIHISRELAITIPDVETVDSIEVVTSAILSAPLIPPKPWTEDEWKQIVNVFNKFGVLSYTWHSPGLLPFGTWEKFTRARARLSWFVEKSAPNGDAKSFPIQRSANGLYDVVNGTACSVFQTW